MNKRWIDWTDVPVDIEPLFPLASEQQCAKHKALSTKHIGHYLKCFLKKVAIFQRRSLSRAFPQSCNPAGKPDKRQAVDRSLELP